MKLTPVFLIKNWQHWMNGSLAGHISVLDTQGIVFGVSASIVVLGTWIHSSNIRLMPAIPIMFAHFYNHIHTLAQCQNPNPCGNITQTHQLMLNTDNNV